MSKLINYAFVGPAGIGKTTVSNTLVNAANYRRHALADALKVGQAFLVHLQLDLPVLDMPVIRTFPNVQRILAGRMGLWQRDDNEQAPWLYREDIAVRDFYIQFVNNYKIEMRTLLQQYGTEVIRALHAQMHPEEQGTANEPWIKVLLRETEHDNRAGYAVCCDDVRYPHEAKALEANGWEIVRIHRSEPFHGIGITEENNQHSSEQMHTKIQTEHVFGNTVPLEALPVKVAEFISDFSYIPNRENGG